MKQGTVGWGTIEKKGHPAAKGELRCKWLIVGGGITGLSAAHFLLERGEKDIIIIEKNTIGSGSTGRSAGMLVFEPEHAPWQHYVTTYGKTLTKAYYDAQQTAVETMQNIILGNNISCGYEQEDLLVLANTKQEQSLILKDFQTRTLLKEQVQLVEGKALHKTFKKSGYFLGEKILGKVSVNPLLFARGFANALKKRGVRIFEESHLMNFTEHTATVNENATIHFETIITARGVQEKNPLLERFLTTICLTNKLSKKELQHTGFLETEMFSDNEGHSFFYGKITKDKRLMVGYGDLKRSGAIEPNYVHQPHVRAIERFLKKAFQSKPFTIDYAWSGEYAISKQDLPVIQINKNHANINGGGTQVVSMVAADFVVSTLLKKKHPLQKLFGPSKP